MKPVFFALLVAVFFAGTGASGGRAADSRLGVLELTLRDGGCAHALGAAPLELWVWERRSWRVTGVVSAPGFVRKRLPTGYYSALVQGGGTCPWVASRFAILAGHVRHILLITDPAPVPPGIRIRVGPDWAPDGAIAGTLSGATSLSLSGGSDPREPATVQRDVYYFDYVREGDWILSYTKGGMRHSRWVHVTDGRLTVADL